MLQIQHICKEYRTGNLVQKALDDVSLNLRDNEFVAILGPSGSGKTTLRNIIGGLDRYDSGDLIINGISTKKYKDRDWDSYRNHTIGFVFQSYNLIPHQTVLSNVELALTISGIGKEERRKRAIDALKKVGLGEQLHKRPSQMSGGQMQRVAIARALVNDPDILLADEPTGALDSDTSIQVMDLLKEVAKDRLVVMVTHNPELAEEYATRIVNLRDGKIRSDTDEYIVDEQTLKEPEHKNMGKSSMSFLTALALSFNNLKTKKARTLLTSFAGSIGIIGIALILALSNGVNGYIQSIEEETLSEYPLQIQSTGFDITSMMVGNTGTDDKSKDSSGKKNKDGQVKVMEMVTNMFSKMNTNDLKSLKKHLEKDNDALKSYTNAVEYDYDVDPQIYREDSDGVRQVHPDKSFSSIGIGADSGANSMMSSMMSTNVFYRMPKNTSLYEKQYDVKAGRWPKKYNECVLVLSQDGGMSDFLLYTLGLRDQMELDDMIKAFASEEEIKTPSSLGTYTYKDILNKKFKLVNQADYYEYDSQYKVWKDKSDNAEYMKKLVADGVVEVMLLGQNVNSYGKTLADKPTFAQLLHEIDSIDGDYWLRFMTSHPKDCSKELIDTIANGTHISKHLHLPFQSGSDRILKAMNRHYDRKKYLDIVNYAKEKIDGVSLTSDIIVGFPGETYEDFKETLSLIREVEFTSLFTFIYSPRVGTPAAKMDDPISAEEKSKWFRELLDVQEEIAAKRCASMVNNTEKVLIESETGKNGELSGRTSGNIIVELKGDKSLIGTFQNVKITQARNWILKGELV